MATEYLSSTTTFSGAVWSGAALATAGDYVVNIQGLAVQTGLDQSAIVSGIDSLDIETAATGIIGGAGASLIVEANTGLARVTNRGAVTLYLTADGSGITNFGASGSSQNYLTSGTFTNVSVTGGLCNIKAATVATNLYATGGSGTIEDNATAITLAVITGGTWVIRRPVTTLIVGPGASVVWDGNNGGAGRTLATANLFGSARLATKSGAITVLNKYGGTLDTTVAERALTIATLNNYTGVAQKVSALATISTETFVGASQKVADPVLDG